MNKKHFIHYLLVLILIIGFLWSSNVKAGGIVGVTFNITEKAGDIVVEVVKSIFTAVADIIRDIAKPSPPPQSVPAVPDVIPYSWADCGIGGTCECGVSYTTRCSPSCDAEPRQCGMDATCADQCGTSYPSCPYEIDCSTLTPSCGKYADGSICGISRCSNPKRGGCYSDCTGCPSGGGGGRQSPGNGGGGAGDGNGWRCDDSCYSCNSYSECGTFCGYCPPSVSLSGPAVVEIPNAIALGWSSSNTDSCSASGDWSGGKPTSGTETIKSKTTTADRGTYNFTLSCSGSGGSASDSLSVKVIQVPYCSIFSADPKIIILPQLSTLSWECVYADSCEIDQGVGSVNKVSGSVDVRPSKTTTYTLDCQGLDGSRQFEANVGVGFIPVWREVFPR